MTSHLCPYQLLLLEFETINLFYFFLIIVALFCIIFNFCGMIAVFRALRSYGLMLLISTIRTLLFVRKVFVALLLLETWFFFVSHSILLLMIARGLIIIF